VALDPDDKKPERPRLTLDVDTELLTAIKRVPNHRAFCIQAIREALQPSLRFCVPPPRHDWPLDELEEFLGAASEILILAVTFRPLQSDSFYQFMKERLVKDDVPVTITMVDPDITDSDPNYIMLNRVYPTHDEGGLKSRLNRSCERLKTLYHESNRAQVPMRVLGIKEIPTVGLTVIDPFPGHCRMRVSMYLDMYPNGNHPYWDIDSATDEGRVACDVFLRHFWRMNQEARVISAAWNDGTKSST